MRGRSCATHVASQLRHRRLLGNLKYMYVLIDCHVCLHVFTTINTHLPPHSIHLDQKWPLPWDISYIAAAVRTAMIMQAFVAVLFTNVSQNILYPDRFDRESLAFEVLQSDLLASIQGSSAATQEVAGPPSHISVVQQLAWGQNAMEAVHDEDAAACTGSASAGLHPHLARTLPQAMTLRPTLQVLRSKVLT